MLAALVIASSATLAGCGGGGGTTTSGSTSGTTGTLTNIRVEGFLHGTTRQVDIGSLVAGDVVDLRLVGFDSKLVKQTISGATFSTSASPSVVQISGSTLTALATTSGTVFTVSGVKGAQAGQANLAVVPSGGSLITGLVRNAFLQGIYLVKVDFYAGSTKVGSTHTVSNGTFRIEVPVTTTRFTINLDEADPVSSDGTTKYYRQFGFGDFDYTANDPKCLAPTPVLHAGGNSMGDIVPELYGSGSPPPPPTGCFG